MTRTAVACSDVPSRWDPAQFGGHRVQYSTNMCFGFALSHALTILSGQYVNPVDLYARLKKVSSSGAASDLTLQSGIETAFANSETAVKAFAGGVCTSPPSAEAETLLAGTSGSPTWKVYSQLLADTAKSCEGKRVQIQISRVADIPITSSPAAALAAIDTLLSRGGVGVLNTSNKMFNSEDVGIHSLALVGSRVSSRTGKCEYLLLDSSGAKDCEKITNVLEKNCETGEIRISSEALQAFGQSLVALMPKRTPSLNSK